jgi:uncharacterized protein (DUF2236 family)
MPAITNELKQKTFVPADSIVRHIWGSTDITLFIFAGAAAEFALNRQADWLYFTGRLPGDPIGRLFSTVRYAKSIIFNDYQKATRSIDRINNIHHEVETKRGARIPDESYKDVLYMLIHYSISAFELLERPLTPAEKDDVVAVFVQMGRGMGLSSLPVRYGDWKIAYRYQQAVNLHKSQWTVDLFNSYRRNLGPLRYILLLQIQAMLAPQHVNKLLGRPSWRASRAMLAPYKFIRRLGWHRPLIRVMVPGKFRSELTAMES